jgi:hypothetical protein
MENSKCFRLNEQQSWQPTQGACDMHIHIGPDVVERYYDCIDLAEDAIRYGMRAIVLKDQMVPSMFKAQLAQKNHPEIKIFGSLVMNENCGGLSPRAVDYALRCKTKVFWFPTIDAANCREKGARGNWIQRVIDRDTKGFPPVDYRVVDRNGEVKPEVIDIMKRIAEANAVLASGHIAPEECVAVLRTNKNICVKFIVTHPNLWPDDFDMSKLKEMVDLGAILELTSGALSPDRGHNDIYEIVGWINEIGYEHFILSTDSGVISTPAPPEEFRTFCYLLNSCGIPKAQVEYMAQTNPAKLLELE